MTHPGPIHVFHGNEAVDPAVAEVAAPLLAAIQHGYEQAKACIVDPSRSPSTAGEDESAFPGTEAIDLRTAALPAVPAPEPGTTPLILAPRPPAPAASPTAGEPAGAAAPAGQRGWWRSLRALLDR